MTLFYTEHAEQDWIGIISYALTTANVVIYEIIEDDVYIYIICHQRKDFVSILQERILR